MTRKYVELGKRLLEEGEWITNPRTGVRCLTIDGADLVYDVGNGEIPMVTTRKSPFKLGVAEILGYFRGVTNAEEFAKLGTKSWFANANETMGWLKNPNRKGENDCGAIYGAQAMNWPISEPLPKGAGKATIDLFEKVYNNLKNGIDDRGEIITYWNPGAFHLGCLRPCMFMYQFTLINGTLHMRAIQRSTDTPLGLTTNMMQCYIILRLMAQITGHKPGKVRHSLTNVHLYEPQYELFKVQMEREPIECEMDVWINPDIKTLEDIRTWVTIDDFKLEGYESHDKIDYPFTA